MKNRLRNYVNKANNKACPKREVKRCKEGLARGMSGQPLLRPGHKRRFCF